MDNTVLKTAIAAFMHEMGQFVPQDMTRVSDEFVEREKETLGSQDERLASLPPLSSVAFIDRIKAYLPNTLQGPIWGLPDQFESLIAGYGKPETPLQWIIEAAHELARGIGANHPEVRSASQTNTNRLRPIWTELDVHEGDRKRSAVNTSYSYPLAPLSSSSIFPIARTTEDAESVDERQDKKRSLFDQFSEKLANLRYRNESTQLWFENFDSLAMFFASAVPAKHAGPEMGDVSWYDLARSSSALAAALYMFHRDTDSLTVEAVRNLEIHKFLIISGDFYGIQDFIFSTHGDMRKYRSKLLRGRSFAVSLFSELAADMLCREIGLPFCSVVLNAAGKFTLIAPCTSKALSAVETVEKRVNKWLLQITFGENALGLAAIEASPLDFMGGRFAGLWERLQRKAEKKKLSRFDLNVYAGVVDKYLSSSGKDTTFRMCPLCGKRPAAPETEHTDFARELGASCHVCRDHVFLGTNLVKKDRVAITDCKYSGVRKENKLAEPIFGMYNLFFPTASDLADLAQNGVLLRHWDISVLRGGYDSIDVSAKFINGYVPVFAEDDRYDDRIFAGEKAEEKKAELSEQVRAGDPKTLGHIAAQALIASPDATEYHGVVALGVLKADVDDLGLLMSCGLSPEKVTLSRLSTMSRQLHLFFSLYLPDLLKTDNRFSDIYTVFAGGDDLFLIGPWNRIIDLAHFLKDSFANYVCHNEAVHFSAGISFHRPQTPIDRMAEDSEWALERSKELGRNRVTVFGETATWDELDDLRRVKASLQEWFDSNWINRAMLYRLNDLIQMFAKEQRIVREKQIHVSDMECTKWRSYLTYTVARNVAKGIRGEQRDEVAARVSKCLADWLTRFGSRLRIPLWEVLYSMR